MKALIHAALIAILIVGAPAASFAQAGLGGLDVNAPRQARPGRVSNIEHPSGTTVWYFELPGGACHGPDCRTDRERTQLMQSRADNVVGQGYRYTFSVMIPSDVPDVDPTNLLLWEIKPMGPGKPSVTFELRGNAIDFVLSDPRAVQGSPMRPLQPAVIDRVTSSARGRWLDFVVDARWARDASGFIDVYLDGGRVVSHRGPNIDANSDRQAVMFGLYRSFISRYKERHGVARLPTQRALFANVGRTTLE